MAEADLPTTRHPQPALTGNGDLSARLGGLMANPLVRRSLPAIAGLGTLAAVAALYMTLAEGPSRMLYASLTDSERAGVIAAPSTISSPAGCWSNSQRN